MRSIGKVFGVVFLALLGLSGGISACASWALAFLRNSWPPTDAKEAAADTIEACFQVLLPVAYAFGAWFDRHHGLSSLMVILGLALGVLAQAAAYALLAAAAYWVLRRWQRRGGRTSPRDP